MNDQHSNSIKFDLQRISFFLVRRVSYLSIFINFDSWKFLFHLVGNFYCQQKKSDKLPLFCVFNIQKVEDK